MGGTKVERCKHRKFWAICGGYWLWCYECGAIRKCDVSQLGTSSGFRAIGKWVRPVGIGGENPYTEEEKRISYAWAELK